MRGEPLFGVWESGWLIGFSDLDGVGEREEEGKERELEK